jgi:hypothetical protein
MTSTHVCNIYCMHILINGRGKRSFSRYICNVIRPMARAQIHHFDQNFRFFAKDRILDRLRAYAFNNFKFLKKRLKRLFPFS